jgi:hypothetical protein
MGPCGKWIWNECMPPTGLTTYSKLNPASSYPNNTRTARTAGNLERFPERRRAHMCLAMTGLDPAAWEFLSVL